VRVIVLVTLVAVAVGIGTRATDPFSRMPIR
jgi:hypothetical protein